MDTTPLPQAPLLSQPALPAPTTNVVAVAKPVAPPKHFLAVFFLSFFLGVFGADRFYLGQYVQGSLKLLTFGWFGIGAIVDLALVMNGAIRDKKGQPLAGYEEYKGLAKKTVTWITVGAALFVVVSGVLTFIAIEQAISHFSPSGIGNALGGGNNPDVSSLLGQ